jgi:hypothetical protein
VVSSKCSRQSLTYKSESMTVRPKFLSAGLITIDLSRFNSRSAQKRDLGRVVVFLRGALSKDLSKVCSVDRIKDSNALGPGGGTNSGFATKNLGAALSLSRKSHDWWAWLLAPSQIEDRIYSWTPSFTSKTNPK